RLLTLTGPGGTGKTRLSLQVATALLDDFQRNVVFVPLAAIHDPELVGPTIAQLLNVKEAVGQWSARTMIDALHDRPLLLALDNFEQVVASAPLLGELLSALPLLKVLVTSRERLHIYGEHDYPVPPLDLPNPKQLPELDQLLEYEAVRLFVDRTRAMKPDFALTPANAQVIAEICVRLDGLPLAIELAAARSRLLPPPMLLEQLTNRLDTLTGGARDVPARQRTLRATLDWSYNLLDAAEQRLFARLGVFVDGCALDAIEAVCNPSQDLGRNALDGLTLLLDKSLLRQEESDSAPRFVMLDTIREYAVEHLERNGELGPLRQLHARHYLAMLERAEPELKGSGQERWLAQMDWEANNLRAALQWAHESAQNELLAQLSSSLALYWHVRGAMAEGRRWLELVLADGDSVGPLLRAKVLHGAGVMSNAQSDYDQALIYFEECLALRRQLGDQKGEAAMLNNLGVVAAAQGDYPRAWTSYQGSLQVWRSLDDTWAIATVLSNLGDVALSEGELARARALLEESLELLRTLGNKRGLGIVLGKLGQVAASQEDYDHACELLEESLTLLREVGDQGNIPVTLTSFAQVVLLQGDAERALALLREALLLHRTMGDKRGIAESLEVLSMIIAAQGDFRRAATTLGAADGLRDAIGAPLPSSEREKLADTQDRITAALGPAAAQTAHAAGRAITLEQALARALDERS
ncbi:MAG TPA: tetratricopeptide repeat protein, partial [Herpetosiphonaceae bacterium]